MTTSIKDNQIKIIIIKKLMSLKKWKHIPKDVNKSFYPEFWKEVNTGIIGFKLAQNFLNQETIYNSPTKIKIAIKDLLLQNKSFTKLGAIKSISHKLFISTSSNDSKIDHMVNMYLAGELISIQI